MPPLHNVTSGIMLPTFLLGTVKLESPLCVISQGEMTDLPGALLQPPRNGFADDPLCSGHMYEGT